MTIKVFYFIEESLVNRRWFGVIFHVRMLHMLTPMLFPIPFVFFIEYLSPSLPGHLCGQKRK